MHEASLPSPDTGANGFHLRRIAVKNISALETVGVRYPNGSHPGAAKLAAFFDACRLAALEAGKQNVPASVTPSSVSGTAGGTQQLTVGKGTSTGAVTYKSSNTAVATVNASGLVTRVAVGEATITVSIAGDANFRAETITANVKVTA